MAHALLVNGTDLATLGAKVRGVTGMGTMPQTRLPTTRVAGRAGLLATGTRASDVSPRTVSVTFTLRPRSLAGMAAALDQLHALCGEGIVRLQDGRDPAKCCYGLFESSDERAFDPQYFAPDPVSEFTFRFTCLDPFRYNVAGTVIGLPVAATPYAVVLGNQAVAPVLRIFGAVTNPGAVYRDAQGVARCTLGYTITLGANDWLEHDFDTGVVRKSVAGTVTVDYSLWTTKSDGLLVLNPLHGDAVSGAGPTLEVTGSGATAEVRYVEAFT